MKKAILIAMVLVLGLSTNTMKADFVFGEPKNLGSPVNTEDSDGSPHISPDGLLLYFQSGRPDGLGSADLWVSTRETLEDIWESPVNLGSTVNSSADDWAPCISPNGLELFFTSKRSGGPGGFSDIWITTRATQEDNWGEPEPLGPNINTSDYDGHPSISSDGLELFFCTWTTSTRPGSGSSDIWVTTRASLSETWSEPENLGATVNSSAFEGEQDISADGLCLFFSGDRAGGSGGWELWVTTRKTKEEPWSNPVNLGPEVNSSGTDTMPDVSDDGSMLYFASDRSGQIGVFDIWQVPIIPIVDFNGDGIVDAADMCIVVDHWGTDNKLCDIGPMPWGDGIVDVQDLIVLAEHLFEGAGLAAHWALDETDGDIAYDSASNIDATVYNGHWTEGKINGALDFNGLTTYMDCSDSLRLSMRKMTLAMWLEPQHMGGMRYVLSRAKEGSDDFDYVLMRYLDGQVEFAVAQEGSESASVMSNATTPLNEWTHVAVCLNGFEAAIYINGQLDASAGYARRVSREDCRLWISSLGADTRFYNGKIDDVRIYNIALSAEEIEELAH